MVKKINESGDAPSERLPAYAHMGLNSGPVILGTVGDNRRMDGTVIGNTVNVAARMLSLTKVFGTKFVTTEKCIAMLNSLNRPGSAPHSESLSTSSPSSSNPSSRHSQSSTFYSYRILDTVKVPGKEEPIVVAEIFEPDSVFNNVKSQYEAGLWLYRQKKFEEALRVFNDISIQQPLDIPTQLFIEKCTKNINEGVPDDWDAVTVVAVK